MAPNSQAHAAYLAMKAFGIDDGPKIKRVLKTLLKVYDKNWKMIEEENYRVLINAIFDDDNNGAVGNDDTPDTDACQKMGAVEDEVEPPLKKRRGQAGPIAGPSSSTSAGLSGLKEPKPEPIEGVLNPTGSDATIKKKKGKQPIATPSLPLPSQAELSGPSRNTSRVDLEIATSSSGEVKISLSCDSLRQRPNFQIPRLEDAIKFMEEKCVSSYKALDPSFSVTKLMKDFCECFLELAVANNSAIAEKSLNHEPAVDSLNRSTQVLINGNGCEVSPNTLPSSFITNCSDNVAEASVSDETCLQDGGTKCLTANGKLIDEPAVDKNANGIMGASSQGLLVVEQHQCKSYDELRLIYDADDITRGEENVKISLVLDSNIGPLSSFHYMLQNVVYCNAHVKFNLARIGDRDCCSTCNGDCLSSSPPCMCSTPSRKGFTYTSEGLVKEEFLNECISMIRNPQKHHLAHCSVCPLEKCKNESSSEPCKGHLDRKFIKECWIKCGCSKHCVNRVVQRGISCKLQVFWTPEGKGWGLRSLDELPKGTFVCEYVGEVLTISELHQRSLLRKNIEKHSYAVILDADWSSKNLQEDQTLCLDSTYYGNVARFINHRCLDANLVEIPVQVEASDRHYYHVALFTTRKVNANEELTWVEAARNRSRARERGGLTMSKRGRGGSAGNKFRMSLGLPVAAVVNCADNTGAKNLYIISVKGIKGRLNRLPSACVGDMVMATVKKGKPDLRKKVMPAVIVRQRKPWRRKDGVFMYFEDNAGVIVNPKGEMKGSAITGPIGKECADLWPRIASAANAIV
ncbi:hypothetical protein V2J09_002236 [Rumex salicifolius]